MTTTTIRLTPSTTLAAMAFAVALGGAAAAQTPQADPDHAAHHPADTATAQATPPTPQPPSVAPGAGGPGMMMGGRGMMGGQSGMGMPDEDGRRRMMMMHQGTGAAPMNVIINVGPGIRVDVEDGDGRGGAHRGMRTGPPAGGGMMEPGMMGMGGPRGGAMGPDALRHFERVDAHLAYVRTALRVTDAQAPQWNAFAEAARAAAERLRQAYAQAMQPGAQPATAPAQMERHMALLSARLEAMRAVATAAGPLYAALTEEQKRTADALMTEHFRDMRRRGP
jgi:hypothetical protein